MTAHWLAYVAKVTAVSALDGDPSPEGSRLREWERAAADASRLPLPTGAHCRHLRQSLGMSKQAMAQVMRCRTRDIDAWERATTLPPEDHPAWVYANLLRFLASQANSRAAADGLPADA